MEMMLLQMWSKVSESNHESAESAESRRPLSQIITTLKVFIWCLKLQRKGKKKIEAQEETKKKPVVDNDYVSSSSSNSSSDSDSD